MLLVTEPSYDFTKFIQILGWIVVPVLTGIILMTMFLHYRKKKKIKVNKEDAETDFVLAAPELFAHSKKEGEYILFDHSRLIHEYKKRMFYNHARFVALQRNYVLLETKYSLVSDDKTNSLIKNKKVSMENLQELANNQDNVSAEKKELLNKLEQLGKSHRRLEEENRFLQEQISMQTAGDDEKEKIITGWKQERKSLLDKIATQDYLQELLTEKKSQIDFLQNQAEQRIKTQHQSNHERQQAVAEMEQAVQQLESLKDELLQKQERTDKLELIICAKEELLAGKEQEINSKLDRITYLENILKETKEQNELLNAEVMDNRNIAIALKEEADTERERIKYLEQKLDKNKQMLRHLYKEISGCVDADSLNSPVIELNSNFPGSAKSIEATAY